jgi:DNA-binding Xre family transcriptional regulator
LQDIFPNWQIFQSGVKFLIHRLRRVIEVTFYEALAHVLNEKGMSPAELSEKTGINQSYFSKLKSGHTKDVTWEKALVIISALDMTPDDFKYIQYGVVSLDDDVSA